MTAWTPKARTFTFVAIGFLVADRITKQWAESALVPHLPRRVLGDFFRFTLTWNQSSAMGLFSFGPWSRWIFAFIAVAMLGVLVALLREAPAGVRWRAAALGAVAGGAIGNLVDRIISARGVTDFIDVGTTGWRFWTFNVADAGVTCGAILLAILLWWEEREQKRQPGIPPPRHTE
ncbi:MAG: signal peptidase II [Gemmatimonadales bacterium]